jgi:hypothetical protein
MFSFPLDSDLASLAESLASHKLPEKGLPRQQPQISDLQKLLQSHHLAAKGDDEISMLSDSSGLSFDSKTSRNRFEIERRANQMATKKVLDSMYQMKVQQGIKLLQAGALSEELATMMELPYKDILQQYDKMKESTREASESNTETIAQEQPDNTSQLENDHLSSQDDINDATLTNGETINIDDDPLQHELPDSDISDDDHSADTQVRGSPNKQLAPGSHNAGPLK